MKATIVSNTWGRHADLPNFSGDLLIHAGNFYPWYSEDRTLSELNQWFACQDFKYKIYVPGPEDLLLSEKGESAGYGRDLLSEATLLVDRSVTIEGRMIYGSPRLPCDGHWAFAVDLSEAESCWSKIPDDTDLLITQMLPQGLSEFTSRTCSHLRDRLAQVKPRHHVIGYWEPDREIISKDGVDYVLGSMFDSEGCLGPIEIEI